MIHVIGPDGKQHGPFRDQREARTFGNKNVPGKSCGDREEDPGAWEVRMSTHDRP